MEITLTLEDIKQLWPTYAKEVWDLWKTDKDPLIVYHQGVEINVWFSHDFVSAEGSESRYENKVFKFNDQYFMFSIFFDSYDYSQEPEEASIEEIFKQDIVIKDAWCYKSTGKPIGELV